MAIQLNERDYLIFKLLAEHNVLLEKHIAWFITHEDKPVLIRDRLRKLFYLDYLLCQRYDDKLSWWTTPTKPLIYMLAPLAKAMSGSNNRGGDDLHNDQQQKYLEIANIRMIFLIAQTKGFLQNLQWKTCENKAQIFNALISCSSQAVNHNLALLSHPQLTDESLSRIEQDMVNEKITNLLIVSRDQEHQAYLQKFLTDHKASVNINKIIFAIHQDLYKSGIDEVQWFNVAGQSIDFLSQSNAVTTSLAVFTDIHAA